VFSSHQTDEIRVSTALSASLQTQTEVTGARGIVKGGCFFIRRGVIFQPALLVALAASLRRRWPTFQPANNFSGTDYPSLKIVVSRRDSPHRARPQSESTQCSSPSRRRWLCAKYICFAC
jgi:hypothetical protein